MQSGRAATDLAAADAGRGRCVAAVLVWVLGTATVLPADEQLERYFHQLRVRGLFSVAEAYAYKRLSDPHLAPEQRTALVLELSRTYADHAAMTGPQQRDALWDKARRLIEDELQQHPQAPQAELLRVQQVMVTAVRSNVLAREALLQPDETQLTATAHRAASQTIEELHKLLEQTNLTTKETSGELTPLQRRAVSQSVLLELGQAYLRRAELTRDQPRERAADVHEAELAFRRVLALPGDLRRSNQAKLGLIECIRLQRDFDRAREMLTTLAGQEPPLSPDLQDALDAARVRTWLDENRAADALEFLRGVRQARPQLSGELWLLQLQALLQLRMFAEQQGDLSLAADLRAEAQLTLQRLDDYAGGIWSRYGRALWSREQAREQYGTELDRLVRQAQREYAEGRREAAAQTYAAAAATAQARGLADLACELSYTQASLLLELEQFEQAAQELQQVAERWTDSTRAAAAHLLAAYALGRRYERERRQTHREAYVAALQEHLVRYPNSPSAGDAHYMLGRLEEQRLQSSKALPHYLAVPVDHPRGAEASVAVARCCQVVITRLKQQGLVWQGVLEEARQALTDRLKGLPDDPTSWTTTQAEAVLGFARLLLLHDPPDYRAADEQLQTLQRVLAAHARDDQPQWKAVAQQVLPLRLLTLAGTGRSESARGLLGQLPADDPQRLWAVVKGLDQLAAGEPAGNIVELTELCVAAVARLEPLRNELAASERYEFDLARLRAYLATGRWDAALEVSRELFALWQKDVTRLQILAPLLERASTAPLLQLARQTWRRIEVLTPAGSEEWLAARAAVIELCVRLGEKQEATKLLQVTRLLYPEPPTAALRERFRTLERQLASSR